MIKAFIKDFALKHPVVTLGGVYICAKTIKKCVYAITGYTGSKDSVLSLNFNVNIPKEVAESINKIAEKKESEETTEETAEEVSENASDSEEESNTEKDELESLTTMFEEWKKRNSEKFKPLKTELGGNDD